MLISRSPNSGIKRLINIQKCRSSTKLDHCALSRLVAHLRIFRLFIKGKFVAYVICTVIFGQKSSKLNSRPIYRLQLYLQEKLGNTYMYIVSLA